MLPTPRPPLPDFRICRFGDSLLACTAGGEGKAQLRALLAGSRHCGVVLVQNTLAAHVIIGPAARLGAPPIWPAEADCEVCALILPPDERLAGMVAPVRIEVGGAASLLLARHLFQLALELPRIGPEHHEDLAQATRLMVRLLLTAPPDETARLPQPGASGLERARRVVGLHLADPRLGPAQLARALAMSRSKLYRLFAASGGVARFIRAERLQAARERLLDETRGSIRSIAADVGFPDQSLFSRAFRRAYGQSPSRFRADAQNAAALPVCGRPTKPAPP